MTIMWTMLFATFGCANAQSNQETSQNGSLSTDAEKSKVYLYKEISPENLVKIYEVL